MVRRHATFLLVFSLIAVVAGGLLAARSSVDAKPMSGVASRGQSVRTPAKRPSSKPKSWTIPVRYRGKMVLNRTPGFREKIIALTFDDGPDPVITPQILRSLRKQNAKATFFMLGANAKRYPKLVKQIAAEGHSIGNHTWSHPANPSYPRASHELERTSKILKSILGYTPQIFRPPYGLQTSSLTRVAKADGYSVILWNMSSADTATKSAAAVVRNSVNSPRPGSIVLFHDAIGKQHTATAMPTVLQQLKKRGYRFVTVPTLLRRVDQYLVTKAANEARRKKQR
jgi:peptidoglycan/xylan/chitin deacetylase (PgdA/CDA1 family)